MHVKIYTYMRTCNVTTIPFFRFLKKHKERWPWLASLPAP